MSCSGRASAVNEPGHSEVRKTPPARSPGCTSLLQKSRRHFLVVALKTQAANAVSSSKYKSGQIFRYGNIFIFCSHYYRSKAIRRAEPGLVRADRARAVDRPNVAPPLMWSPPSPIPLTEANSAHHTNPLAGFVRPLGGGGKGRKGGKNEE